MADGKPGRIFYIDAIRAYAILLVVFSHVFAPIVHSMTDSTPVEWMVANILDSIVRVCVPLFVMISGTLLLRPGREESPLEFLRRRFLKILPSFFTWSMIYAAWEARMNGEGFSAGAAALKSLSEPTEFHLWFVYMLVTLYLATPFLRGFVKSAGTADFAYVLSLWFGCLCLNQWAPGFENAGPAWTFVGFAGYFLAGAFLSRFEFMPKTIYLAAVASLAIVAADATLTYAATLANGGIMNELYYNYRSPGVALYALLSFIVLKSLPWAELSTRRWVDWLITTTSAEAYNLYLIHVAFIWIFLKGSLGFTLNERTGGSALIGVPLETIAILLCSYFLSRLLQRIPGLWRLLVLRV